jgi:pimeloyl-ACP methyl ester carboxylesterase
MTRKEHRDGGVGAARSRSRAVTVPTRAVRLLTGIAVIAVLLVGLRRAVPLVLARFFRVERVGLDLGPSDFGLDAEEVTIRGPNQRALRGWFVASPSDDRPRPAVLVIHGWNSAASLMLPIVSLVHAAGAHAFFLDARCHGRSDDDRFASMPRFAEDIDAGLRWLRDDVRVMPGCIVLLGHSVGAGASLLAASRDPRVAAVVSIAAMAHPGTLMRANMRAYGVPAPLIALILREIERTVGMPFDAFAPISTISRIRAPVLLVHGGRDNVVPPTDATRLARASAGRARLLVVPEADHASLDAFLLAASEVTSFIEDVLDNCQSGFR